MSGVVLSIVAGEKNAGPESRDRGSRGYPECSVGGYFWTLAVYCNNKHGGPRISGQLGDAGGLARGDDQGLQ